MSTPSTLSCIGIDYGSKLAGTTVLACVEDNAIQFHQSRKKQDADQFILDLLEARPGSSYVFLDAPLSLPAAYYGRGDDFFYRQADKSVQAMSPMFLGGLTARAIRLTHQLRDANHQVFEVYPGHLARIFGLKPKGYKKEKDALNSLSDSLASAFPYPMEAFPRNWHQFDALLALLTGFRFLQKQHHTFGHPDEGCIIV